MLGVPHCNSKKITARSRTARTARIARTALALGVCTAALTLSAGTASASAHVAGPSAPDPVTACQSAAAILPETAAGQALAFCKLVNGWD
ncbi:hypothetical protein [Streptomyces sp. NP-1717]|uniref:hypothetical protein n=1 Tax=unclassified Streptomyces TaxID=2593676 RepID=UPI001F5C5457|nr:hypothetical protein [Streptomyces sp. NP-1717]MCI3226965.1 hypothetical protein [Streptomyces sp. NP-1717]WTA73771.1 hypothetical protein OG705_13285 [Streptomyces sp. NBC_00838]